MQDSAETMRRLVARINANAYLPPDVGSYIAARRSKMAKQVKLKKGQTFEFKAGKSGGSKYPWDDWFTGELLELEQAVGTGVDSKGNITGITDPKDFAVSLDGMIPKIKTAGRRRYLMVDVSRFDQDGKRLPKSLIIRSRPMLEIERIEENEKRVFEKARDEATKKARLAKGLSAEPDEDEDDNDDPTPSDVE